MVRVQTVAPDSIADELGLTPGFELISVNGSEIEDFLDWEFHTAEGQLIVEARSPAGDRLQYDIERPEGVALGIELEPPHIRRCANRCDFCFVDGLPDGLRQSLYIRDDDYRLSFRYGNFATLTNLKPKDERRILEYRLSPLYVSVHATDAVVRRRLLRNPRAPAIVPQLAHFAEGGIRFHTQIVLQPGLNDGVVLEQSVADLYELGEAVLSVSVVPVGLTEYSKSHLVREPTHLECRAAVQLIEDFSQRAVRERGRHWVYGSDDLFLVAGLSLPEPAAYDDFEQVENGVGSVRFLQQCVRAAHAGLTALSGRRIGILTGSAMSRLMPQVCMALHTATGGDFEVIEIENDLFGPSVTSAGLLPGNAFMAALRAHSSLDLALLPAEAVNEAGHFLDGMVLDDLVQRSPVPVHLSYDFADVLTPQVLS
jgi:putative radical SAM enzyme (TIGR03279 family)